MNTKQEDVKATPQGNGGVRVTTLGASLHKIVRDYEMGLKLLPDVKDFSISLGAENELFQQIGIKIKDKPKLKFKPWKNKKANRFVVGQYLRLDKYRNSPGAYGKIAWALMKSRSYIVLTLHKIEPNGHRELPYWKVLNICRDIQQMAQCKFGMLDYKRVYINKVGNTFRPLGVPTLVWRVYLSMYANILRFLVKTYIPSSQHAYMPKRGVITAWKDIINNVLEAPDIYEFDLKQFFPNVKTDYIIKTLRREFHLPKEEQNFLLNIFQRTPRLPDELKLSENRVQFQEKLNEYLGNSRTFVERPDIIFHNMKYINEAMAREEALRDRDAENYFRRHGTMKGGDPRDMQEDNRTPYFVNRLRRISGLLPLYQRGVPQGTPISPILSILALVRPLRDEQYVMYADDGVLYGRGLPDDPFPTTMEAGAAGVLINRSKSKGVKREGKGLTTLKFLGMEYDPFKNTFKAKTRNGATLEFGEVVKFITGLEKEGGGTVSLPKEDRPSLRQNRKKSIMELAEKYGEDFTREHTGEEAFKSKFIGFIFSRMQGNEGNPEIAQSFELTFERNSGMDLKSLGYMRRECTNEQISIFNGSSFASHCLLHDLKWKHQYSNKKMYYQGLRFAAKKIRTKFVNLFKKIRLTRS